MPYMIDWTASMKQTYEYYIVDPKTWHNIKKVDDIIDSKITRDLENETLGSSTLTSSSDYTDKYIRTYLIAEQNGIRRKIPLGTHIFQSPSGGFNGKRKNFNQDGYTPLIELKEKSPEIGFFIPTGTGAMSIAYQLCKNNLRAPVVKADDDTELGENFICEDTDTWLSYITDLIGVAEYTFDLDELGRVLFMVSQDVRSMQPVWVYTDDNSSILYPDVTIERDLYGVPNVVEIVYSPNDSKTLYSRAVNDDPNSPTSTVTRGREILYREDTPNVPAGVNQAQLDEYAKKTLQDMSALEYTLTYTHGYCPVTIGDCVELNYEKAGLRHIKAKVIRQEISCESGCPVEETAVFTKPLWRYE